MTLRQFCKLTGYHIRDVAHSLKGLTPYSISYMMRDLLDTDITNIPGAGPMLAELAKERLDDCVAVCKNTSLMDGVDLYASTKTGMDGKRVSMLYFPGTHEPLGMITWPVEVGFPLGHADICISLARSDGDLSPQP